MRRESWKFFAIVVLVGVACAIDGRCSMHVDGHEAGCVGPGAQ